MAEGLFILLAGLCLGSFAGAMASRYASVPFDPFRPSECDACHRRLGVIDLLPVLGWVLRGGTSRCCGTAIPATYPILEFSGLIVGLLAVIAGGSATEILVLAALGWTLLLASAIDLETFLLPDPLTLGLLAAGLIYAGLTGFPNLLDAALAAAVGFMALAGISGLYCLVRGRSGLGLGDAKLLAAGGAWVGLHGLAPAVGIGALATLAVVLSVAWIKGRSVDGSTAVPFGPGLAVGIYAAALGDALL